MFELLLSTSVKHVSVHEVRSFFRQQFVTAMRQLGTGLEQLAIRINELLPGFCCFQYVWQWPICLFQTDDSSWLHSRENLPAALGRMTHLRKISLHFLANDTMVITNFEKKKTLTTKLRRYFVFKRKRLQPWLGTVVICRYNIWFPHVT